MAECFRCTIQYKDMNVILPSSDDLIDDPALALSRSCVKVSVHGAQRDDREASGFHMVAR